MIVMTLIGHAIQVLIHLTLMVVGYLISRRLCRNYLSHFGESKLKDTYVCGYFISSIAYDVNMRKTHKNELYEIIIAVVLFIILFYLVIEKRPGVVWHSVKSRSLS